jgi:hypothetical protein
MKIKLYVLSFLYPIQIISCYDLQFFYFSLNDLISNINYIIFLSIDKNIIILIIIILTGSFSAYLENKEKIKKIEKEIEKCKSDKKIKKKSLSKKN